MNVKIKELVVQGGDNPLAHSRWTSQGCKNPDLLCWCNSHDILQRPPSNWQRYPHNWAYWYNCAWKYTVVSGRVWISWTISYISTTLELHIWLATVFVMQLTSTFRSHSTISSLLFPRGLNLLMGYALRHVATHVNCNQCHFQYIIFILFMLH